MISNYNQLRANISLIIENACISEYTSKYFQTEIFSVEAVTTQNALKTLDKSVGLDQIHVYINKDDESFGTSNRICFVKKEEPTKYFKIKYKRTNNKTEYDIWKKYNIEYFSKTKIYPLIPSYFIQSFVDLELKYKIQDLLKKGISVDSCIELIKNKEVDFNADDYIKEIAYAHITDLIDAIESRSFKEKIYIEDDNNKLHWAYVDWIDVKDLGIIF